MPPSTFSDDVKAGSHLARELLQRSHCGYFLRALACARETRTLDIRSSGGKKTSGTIIDAGVTLGTWTYAAQATS
jgi:hypothetical protein